jgi:transketolase
VSGTAPWRDAPAHIDARAARRLIVDTAYRAGVGHVGSALSVVEILCVLYGGVLRIPAETDPDRDRFILSKGHAALALYAVLTLTGRLPLTLLDEYCRDGGALGVHPSRGTPGIDFSTGSLGHGLSYGAGAALSARLQGSTRRAVVLVSDAELNAGSTWEAVQFAAHHRLGALTAIVDANGLQAFGRTADVISLEPIARRFAAFDWDAIDVDGHDAPALRGVLSERRPHRSPPLAVIARTTLGRGVSFMEGRLDWHYLPLDSVHYAAACRELGEVTS